jgi:peptidoglycan/LPS O-acetylase OafA/YrhL
VQQAVTAAQSGKRLTELDGLRGLAAIMVFSGHAILMTPISSLPNFISIMNIDKILSGHEPVYLFFVLSGFVLSFPFFNSGKSMNYIKFLMERAFRIYPAFWAAIVFSLGSMLIFDPTRVGAVSEWGQSFWEGGIGAVPLGQLVRHFILFPDFDIKLIDPPFWSLRVELKISALVPLFMLMLRLNRVEITVGVVLMFVFVGIALPRLHFVPFFIFGIALARHWISVTRITSNLPLYATLLLVATSFFAFENANIFFGGNIFHECQVYLSAAGSAALIVLASARPGFRHMLRKPLIQFFGKISYSMYLIHFPVLMVSASWLSDDFGMPIAALLALGPIFLLSYFSYHYVERPGIRLGRRFIERLFQENRTQNLNQPTKLDAVG